LVWGGGVSVGDTNLLRSLVTTRPAAAKSSHGGGRGRGLPIAAQPQPIVARIGGLGYLTIPPYRNGRRFTQIGVLLSPK
jgi:hypothetical protein